MRALSTYLAILAAVGCTTDPSAPRLVATVRPPPNPSPPSPPPASPPPASPPPAPAPASATASTPPAPPDPLAGAQMGPLATDISGWQASHQSFRHVIFGPLPWPSGRTTWLLAPDESPALVVLCETAEDRTMGKTAPDALPWSAVGLATYDRAEGDRFERTRWELTSKDSPCAALPATMVVSCEPAKHPVMGLGAPVPTYATIAPIAGKVRQPRFAPRATVSGLGCSLPDAAEGGPLDHYCYSLPDAEDACAPLLFFADRPRLGVERVVFGGGSLQYAVHRLRRP